MAREKEYEKRAMLDERQYQALLEYGRKNYPSCSAFEQVNHYFDTPEKAIIGKGGILRLRIVSTGKRELTVKIKGEDGDTEINQPLNEKEADMILRNGIFPEGEIREVLGEYGHGLGEYHYLTALKCRRHEFPGKDHLLVIDENEYSGITDYDVEIEAGNLARAEEVLRDILSEFGIEYKKNYLSKSRRAIQAIRK